jgi:hypothetical protein
MDLTMKVDVVPAKELSEELAGLWATIQVNNPVLFSPFFRPEFTRAVGEVRDDTFVAVIDNGIAFFPLANPLAALCQTIMGLSHQRISAAIP